MSSSEQLANFAERVSFDELPKEVINKAKYIILDSIGCILGASGTDIAKIIISLAKEIGGKPESTIIGDGTKVSTISAVFANAGMNNILDFDDIYYGHGESTVVPPALAIGEKIAASGKDIITAVVLGYEIHSRIAAYVHPRFLERKGKTLGIGTNQTFDTVAVASKLLKLDKKTMINALGIAGSCAPVASILKTVLSPKGITNVKNNFCFAAQTGVISALLAERGYTGPEDILDGDTGFWRMQGAEKCDFSKITENLGVEYKILNDGFKRYPSNGLIHPVLDAVLSILKEHSPKIENIDQIVIETTSQLSFPTYQEYDPKDLYSREFSIPYVISAAIIKPEPGLEWYSKEMVDNLFRKKLANKVQVKVSEDADKTYREKNSITANVKMKVKNQMFVETGKTPRDKPTSDQELEEKFMLLTKNIVSNPQSIISQMAELEYLSDIRKLVSLLY